MKAKQKRKEKREKIGVAKGYGPRHSENVKEGQDLTKINTDNVPALLTPREAVLNRNAAELAGRGAIEKLNARGNKLAEQGVDLASKPQKLQGGSSGLHPGNINDQYELPQGGGEVPFDPGAWADPGPLPSPPPDPNVSVNQYPAGWQQINENPFYASQHQDLQLVNKLGWDPSKPTVGFGSGVPTQKGIGTAASIAGNVVFPGLGLVTGPLAKWITKMIQSGASKGDVGRMLAKAQAKAPPMPSGSVELGQGEGGVQAEGFGGWYNPDYLKSIGYTPGQGTGSLWIGGPTGGQGGGGIGGQGGSFFGDLPGVRGGPLAGSFGRGFGSGGPSNLTWGQIGMEGQDRPHFNPFFGGQSADKMAGGPSVKLRQKGDTDVKATKEKPKKLQGGTDAVGKLGKPNYWPGGQPPTGPFPGRGPGGVYPPEQVGGMQGPQPGLAWQHKRNMAPQGPGLDWQRKRAAAVAGGQDQPLMPPGGGPYPSPMPAYNRHLGGGFYPPGGPLHGQTGIDEVQTIGEPPKGEEAYGPPVQLSAPQLDFLKAAAKEQGLNASQIAGLTKAFSSFGGGGGYSSDANVAGAQDVSGGFYGLSQSPRGYAGGISEIGYPPFVAPGAEYHGDKGGWQGRYDPMYMIPLYQRGTSMVGYWT